jgi:putative endonuclease
MAEHNNLGKTGEKEAVEFLKKNQFEILETNFRWQKAEVDIIAQKDDTIIFTEVKTRSTAFFGNPEEQVTAKKQQLLADAADFYVNHHNLNLAVRFDIISIVKEKNTMTIRHIENAFYPFQE